MRGPDHFILFCDSAQVWCAAPSGFRDMVLDPTGWGLMREDAVAALLAHPEFQERARLGEWAIPTFEDFVVVKEPQGGQFETVTYGKLGTSNREAALRRQTFRVI